MQHPDKPHLIEITARLRQMAAAGDSPIAYSDLGSSLSPPIIPVNLSEFLDAINRSEHRAGRGLLSTLVVNKETGIPGDGFFGLAEELGRDITDRRHCWENELRRVYTENAL